MNTQRLIEALEEVVRDRTPTFINPKGDKKLMQAHYLLAKLYGREEDLRKAHAHLREATQEFLKMCRNYILRYGYVPKSSEEKIKKQERKTERRLARYKSELLRIADEIGYDALIISWIPTSRNLSKIEKL
ncbi:hypothetical protein B6U82_00600 [Candidatus Pacearchaeota archaeon ex4484_31]|nr:MAG: hypothetical protein B6U82_00600 [Candidatus Pacearchaeota archaeon ex4484_31]